MLYLYNIIKNMSIQSNTKKRKKDKTIQFRVTEEEYNQYINFAEKKGLSVSQVIRFIMKEVISKDENSNRE